MSKEINNQTEKKQWTLYGVMQRFLIYCLIFIACFHICRIWLNTDWKLHWDILVSFMWSLNVFHLKSFRCWFLNVSTK